MRILDMPGVFISHSSLDHERVEREIISLLRAHGLETWYAIDSIKSASEWERQIFTGLKKCDWFLIVLTPRSVTSEWVAREVHWAFLKRKDRIIPVMLETCEPDDLHLGLLPLQFIDFRNEVAIAQDRLLAIWGLDKATQVKTHYHTALEALGQEDWRAAIEHLESVLRLDPAHSKAEAELNYARQHQGLASLYDAGLTYLHEKRWHEALATLHEVQGIDADYRNVTDSIAMANAELQKEEAERVYREALGAADREEWATAVERLEAVLKLNPSHAEAQGALSRAEQRRELAESYTVGCEHLQAKRWREALKSFRRVRAIDKTYRGVADLIAEADAGLDEEEEKEELYREALSAVDREDWDTARERLQTVTAVDPGNDKATAWLAEIDLQQQDARLFNAGLQHVKNGRWAEALSTFRQVQEAAGVDYKDVAAQIERAETELKTLPELRGREWKEQKLRDLQAGKEAQQERRADAETTLKDEATRDIGLAPAADTNGLGRTRLFGSLFVLLLITGAFFAGALLGARFKERIPFLATKTQPVQTGDAPPPEEPFVRFERTRRQVDKDPRGWMTTDIAKELVNSGVQSPLESPNAEFLYLYGRANLLTGNTDEASKAFDAAIAKSHASPATLTIKTEAFFGLAAISVRTQRDRWKVLYHYGELTKHPDNKNAP
ncbi:MAG TPA: TIR domain-containing protein [Pyrinomonadaceae bacterium]